MRAMHTIGCALAIGLAYGTVPGNAALSVNAVTVNALNLNGVFTNALTSNALTQNAVTVNALNLNGVFTNAVTSNALSQNALSQNGALPGLAVFHITGPDDALANLNGVAVEAVVLPQSAGR